MAGFAHLHVASGYSPRYGASHPEQLAARATERGMDALALTDPDTVTGAVRFAGACEQAGIRPPFGIDLAVEPLAPAPDGPRRRTAGIGFVVSGPKNHECAGPARASIVRTAGCAVASSSAHDGRTGDFMDGGGHSDSGHSDSGHHHSYHPQGDPSAGDGGSTNGGGGSAGEAGVAVVFLAAVIVALLVIMLF